MACRILEARHCPGSRFVNVVEYGPGTLVRARGREWIVLAGSDSEVLRVRPVSGSEDDQTLIHVGLEPEQVTLASFPPPTVTQKAGHDAALLLRDALLLSLRRGAGPFRSFGQIAVEPRAYQLVPLLMALKLDPVRLLIADDVGIGKTIEAALIVRELLDRSEIDHFAVLCPPHLVDQWLSELETRFHLRAVPVTAASANRLERDLPQGTSIFTAHPHTVVSLDYIKSDKRRDEFLRACPKFVVVDEAHTCANTGQGRHQRYELLKGLAQSSRHLVMLTATPHSGDDAAFYRLLGLLDPKFERLQDVTGDDRDDLRERLADHFVQRRREDIDEWRDGTLFPKRDSDELTYRLTGAWEQFLEHVLNYCAGVVERAEGDERKQRLNFWGTLALMRCVGSSPAAAVQALRTRAGIEPSAIDDELEARVFDGTADLLPEDDVEPPIGDEQAELANLIAEAEHLTGHAGDPKLKVLIDHVHGLIGEGFNPVVFCRYISTAHYLGRYLPREFKNVAIDVVTGELASEQRKEKVEVLGDAERRLLIATDCLSEGINLQEDFDAVVHYDLSWNPTRHEQREGRVDRFGQKSPIVRATLMYGSNNPVDGAVLDVIIRKAAKIRQRLGVPVPLPDDGHALAQALLKAVLLRRRGGAHDHARQLALFDSGWQLAEEKAKRNRTVFAQHRLKPDEVLPEWKKTLAAIGGADDVRRFIDRSLSRLGSGLEALPRGFKVPLGVLPDDIRERLYAEGLEGAPLIDFSIPPAPRCRPVHRSHPLVAVLAETLLERTLGRDAGDANDIGALGRVGCWVSGGVAERTVLALLRVRHQLILGRGAAATTLLVEEATSVAWAGSSSVLEGADALTLLADPPLADPPSHVRERAIAQALEQLDRRRADFEAFAERRAQELLADHRRVREASDARGNYRVKALLPPDIVGVFVLLPRIQ
jgi:superfamily II DNA or RNA helicase